MRKASFASGLVGLSFGLLASVAPASAQNVSVGLAASGGRVQSFYVSVGAYFHVPEAGVVAVKERYRLADEELPVVFFLAARAGVEPSAVVELRLRKMSWWDIGLRFGLNPEIFFVPVAVTRIGPPYGRAYGYYKRLRGQKHWGTVVLYDEDVVNLVNLRFISGHYGIPAERVMEMRGRGSSFLDIHEKALKEKAGRTEKDDKGQPGKARGRVK
jgi:hypothetical protein